MNKNFVNKLVFPIYNPSKLLCLMWRRNAMFTRDGEFGRAPGKGQLVSSLCISTNLSQRDQDGHKMYVH